MRSASRSRAAPDIATRPFFITYPKSAMPSASMAACSTSRTVVPPSRRACRVSDDQSDDARREAERRLVQHQGLRLHHQGPRDGQHLLLSAGQRAARHVAPLGEDREALVLEREPLCDHRGRQRSHMPGADEKIVLDREVGHDLAPLRHVDKSKLGDPLGLQGCKIVPLEPDAAGRDGQQPRDGSQQGRLSRAVCPDDADQFPGGHAESYIREDLQLADPCRDAADLDHARASAATGSPSIAAAPR